MSLKRQRSPDVATATSSRDAHDIWVSSKIEDRASIFVAYFSPTMPPRDLQSNGQLKSADHRMLAWRVPGSQRTLVAKSRALETGFDDDGENYGGKRVLKVLEEMHVEGSLVVARWYGGIMLGPVRFTHIEDVARDAIRSWRQKEESEQQKRRKVEDEANEKANLVVDLKDRDQSIKVLRGLLEDATNALKAESEVPKSNVASTTLPAREIDYSSMTLEHLRRMDKARDTTIAFLLKKIDETESQAKTATSAKTDEPQTNGEGVPDEESLNRPGEAHAQSRVEEAQESSKHEPDKDSPSQPGDTDDQVRIEGAQETSNTD